MQYDQIFKFIKKHPNSVRCARNFSLVTCFTISLCSAAYTFKVLDEFLMDSEHDNSLFEGDPSKLNLSQIKAILDQRGVLSSHLLESDLQQLFDLTGNTNKRELLEAEQMKLHMQRINFSSDPDGALYERLVELGVKYRQSQDISIANSHSIAFETESEFVERVEDNKDSVWLLAVIATVIDKEFASYLPATSIINKDIWTILSHRYRKFGFKLGLLNCATLRGICIDRGFINADLILAFPRGGERMKDMVQFRPLPRSSAKSHLLSDSFNKHILDGIHYWIVSILSRRVRELKNFNDLFSSPLNLPDNMSKIKRWSSWLMTRSQPVHVLWCPCRSKLRMNTVLEIPLVLSALSVPYTGRVRFWTMNHETLNENTIMRLSNSYAYPKVTSFFSNALNCASPKELIIITPEGNYYVFGKNNNEFLSYRNVELFLRFLYPSVDDFLCLLVFVLNGVIILDAVIEGGHLIFITYYQSTKYKFVKPFIHSMSTRFNLASTVISLARRGWSSHIPSAWLNSSSSRHHRTSVFSGNMNSYDFRSNSITLKRLVITNFYLWFRIFITELLSANVLLLLTVLPVLNLLNLAYMTPLVNIFLYLLRSLVLSSPIVSLRLAIIFGCINWRRFFLICALFVTVLISFSTYFHSKSLELEQSLFSTSGSRCRSGGVNSVTLRSRLNQLSPDQLWIEFTHLLVQSDAESLTSLTASSNSSTTESDNSNLPGDAQQARRRNVEIVEGLRLLRRLRRLHNVLSEQCDHIPPPPIENIFNDVQLNQDDCHTAAAHLYTWNCFPSCTRLHDKSDYESYGRNILNVRRRKARKRITMPVIDKSLLDDDCDAEDELDDSSSNESKWHNELVSSRVSCRHIVVQCPGEYRSSSTDSFSGPSILLAHSVRHPTRLHNSSQHERNHKQGKHSCAQKNWPSWVVPCEACTVCWCEFRPGVRLGALPCGHGFHELCIRKWLDTGAFDCPVCRWPAYAPHLRQQRQIVGQLITAVQRTVTAFDMSFMS